MKYSISDRIAGRRYRRMTIIPILLLCAMLAAPSAMAFKLKLKKEDKPTVDFAAWVKSMELPSTDETGNRLFYPTNNTDDSVAVVVASLPVEKLSAEQAFYAAMLYAVSNLDEESGDCVLAVDYDKRSFVILLRSTQGASTRETTYARNLRVEARDGGLDCRVTGISAKYRDKGIIPRTVALEKLHPESNDRHAELVTEFTRVNSDYLNAMASYAASRGDVSITHLRDIRESKVVTGMNPDEVTLVKGAPFEVRKSGERLRWIYGDGSVVIFTDGKVTRVTGG